MIGTVLLLHCINSLLLLLNILRKVARMVVVVAVLFFIHDVFLCGYFQNASGINASKSIQRIIEVLEAC